jgi:hypothetical protein
MKQLGVILVMITFVAAVSFVVASEQYKQGRMAISTLTGLAEVGHFGDPDGKGIFKYKVDRAQNQFCYELTVSNIEGATSAAIHSGTRDAQGALLVTLQSPIGGSSKGCITLAADKLAELVKNPTSYYVNIQNAEFPAGAIRGQLTNVR